MAKITVNPEYNLVLIAENAGQGDIEKRQYRDGFLHVEGVTQKALDDALAAYDHAQDAPQAEPSEIEVLREALKAKGTLTDADMTGAKNALKTEKRPKK